MNLIAQKIKELALQKNAVILAHNYQPQEIQEIAHLTGDSLELAQDAVSNNADIILLCGVHFMAESAAILSPNKKVLLPDTEAGCPMADMVLAEDVKKLKLEHPNAKVVTYINSSAQVKAESDVICTSSNALKIVQKIDSNEIIFLPDKNLGSYVQRFTDKKIILSNGYCPIHERFSIDDLINIKVKHPDAFVIAHPECRPEIIDSSDAVLSTGEMVNFVRKTSEKKIIVVTESDMINRLKTEASHIWYIKASDDFVCPDMKKIMLQKILDSLTEEKYIITVDEEISARAHNALKLMLELSI